MIAQCQVGCWSHRGGGEKWGLHHAVINNFVASQLVVAGRERDHLIPAMAERMKTWLRDNYDKVEREALRSGRETFHGFLDEVLPGRWRDPRFASDWEPDDYALFGHTHCFAIGGEVNGQRNLAFTVILFANLGIGPARGEDGEKRRVELGRMLARLYSAKV